MLSPKAAGTGSRPPGPPGGGPARRAPPAEPAARDGKAAPALPDWLARAAPSAPKAARSIAPSKSGATPAVGDRTALTRGRIVHRLLQALPTIALERRAEAARRYAVRNKGEFGDAECAAMTNEVLALLGDPVFAPLFAPGSRAEVPIVGRLPGGSDVSGQVDRLAVTDAAILIADYKTDRPAPRRVEHIPEDYVRQLALYRAVLAALSPRPAV